MFSKAGMSDDPPVLTTTSILEASTLAASNVLKTTFSISSTRGLIICSNSALVISALIKFLFKELPGRDY